MKIAFQTLACPDWTWEHIVSEAKRLGYQGIEIRGVEGEMDLTKIRSFLPERIERTKAELKDAGLEICCLDTGCAFHNAERYDKAIVEGKAAIDLAVKLGVPYTRVFGDVIPDHAVREDTISQVVKGLQELGSYAEGTGVMVLLETHGDFNQHGILTEILGQINPETVGILWDFEHPFMHGESIDDTYSHLSSRIRHTHVKDARIVQGEKQYCLIGDGEVPVRGIVQLMRQSGYTGWLSLEYEKKWFPSLEEPEVSLPAYIQYIKQCMEE